MSQNFNQMFQNSGIQIGTALLKVTVPKCCACISLVLLCQNLFRTPVLVVKNVVIWENQFYQ